MPNWLKNLPFFSIIILLSGVSFIIGIILVARPALAIEMQRRFYEKINWRFEPISMTKEIRNTRIMGLIFIGIALAAIALLISSPEPQLSNTLTISAKNF